MDLNFGHFYIFFFFVLLFFCSLLLLLFCFVCFALCVLLCVFYFVCLLVCQSNNHLTLTFHFLSFFPFLSIKGTHVLLEAAKEHSVQRFIHVSTDEVYGEGVQNEEHAMLEESVLEPTNPYAATKAAAEFLVKAYHRSFQLPVIITRGNNARIHGGRILQPSSSCRMATAKGTSTRSFCIVTTSDQYRNGSFFFKFNVSDS